jgi:hypothetical protein
MSPNMADTIDQLINLTIFARKINVPFEVYGFNSYDSSYEPTHTPLTNEYELLDIKLVNLLSSSFTKTQIEEAYKFLLLYKQSFLARNSRSIPDISLGNKYFRLGSSTPLNKTLVLAIEVAKSFREKTKVEILNTIILTDGDATDDGEYWSFRDDSAHKGFVRTRPSYYKNKYYFKYDSASYPVLGDVDDRYVKLTISLLEMYKSVTNSNVINFHIAGKLNKRSSYNSHHASKVGNKEFSWIEWDKNWNKQQASGVVEIKDALGFNTRYILSGDTLNIRDQELTVKSDSKGDLLRGFRKFASSKSQQRILIQKFIPQVA